MANILIDGYNLIGTTHKNLEKARNDLIQGLSRYAKIKQHEITVIFDGWKAGQALETRERIGGINVIYSRLGEKADQVIKNILASATKPWIAVSSDREIYQFAEKRSHAALTRDEFGAKLDSAFALGGQDDAGEHPEDEDSDQAATAKKGNPRKLSRKDKRKMEALKKL